MFPRTRFRQWSLFVRSQVNMLMELSYRGSFCVDLCLSWSDFVPAWMDKFLIADDALLARWRFDAVE